MLDAPKRLALPVALLLMIAVHPILRAQTTDGAVYVATYIDVQPNETGQAVALIKTYRDSSRREPGNTSSDAFQEVGRTNRFILIETWKDQSSFETHDKAQPTSRLRSELKPLQRSPYDQRVNHGFATAAFAGAAAAGDAIFVATHVDVPGNFRVEAEGLLTRLSEESRKDDGNIRYEVYQQSNRTNHFTVFAAWTNNRTFDANQRKPHWLQFREALAPMLGALYDERLYKSLN